jgi:hypothetical protein
MAYLTGGRAKQVMPVLTFNAFTCGEAARNALNGGTSVCRAGVSSII